MRTQLRFNDDGMRYRSLSERVGDAASEVVPDRVKTVVKAVALPFYMGTALGVLGAGFFGTIGVFGGPVTAVTAAIAGGGLGIGTGFTVGSQLGLAMLKGD